VAVLVFLLFFFPFGFEKSPFFSQDRESVSILFQENIAFVASLFPRVAVSARELGLSLRDDFVVM
jgi:hypothetical protein